MKQVFLSILLLDAVIFGFSQSNNYADGNGTIIEIQTDGNIKRVFRKHIQNIEIGELALNKNGNMNIYDKPELKGKIIGKLKLKDNINITQVMEETIADNYSYWVNITTDNNINGWVFCGTHSYEYAQFAVPYFDNRWEIIENISIGGKSWTARKMIDQRVAVWEVLNIRDKPGLAGTRIISKIIPPEVSSGQINLNVMEATEEMEIIDGITDRWLKIKYNGVEGWVFGGYANVERGGPKYITPESRIDSNLGCWH